MLHAELSPQKKVIAPSASVTDAAAITSNLSRGGLARNEASNSLMRSRDTQSSMLMLADLGSISALEK